MPSTKPTTTGLDLMRERGQIINLQGKEYTTHEGPLKLAHEDGLTGVDVELLSWDASKRAAVCRATATGKRGTYSDLGDACPENVGRAMAGATLRMASTRASSRSLRLFLGIGMTAYEELPPSDAPAPARERDQAPAPTPAPTWEDAPPQTATGGVPSCPACQGPMWDNSQDKTNPRSPDYKCKQQRGECKHDVGRDGSLSPGKWPTAMWAKDMPQGPAQAAQAPEDEPTPQGYEADSAPVDDSDIPF